MFELKTSSLLYGFIILAYIIGVTYTPNWMALDTNATKFVVLSMLNLLGFGMLLAEKRVQGDGSHAADFFRTAPGFAYTGFLAVSLLSLTQSVNHLESIFSFAKLFSVFSAAFILSVILMRDMRYIMLIIFSMTALLLLDAASVFYNIILFIQGTTGDIAEIKTLYSNKNILASSLFVKLPFALWLLVFDKGWKSWIGCFALSTGMLAIFFISTRAFYLGLIVFSSAFLVFSAIDYYRKREPDILKAGISCTGALIMAFLIYSVVNGGLYPESVSRYTDDVSTRIASIQDDAIEKPRMESWKWTLDLIKENPFLGVGAWQLENHRPEA